MEHILLLLLLSAAVTHSVKLSNVQLPICTDGTKLITGEADVLAHQGAYYLYFNNWGDCPGVNCCDDPAGCATCCFGHPPHPYSPGCGSLTNGSDPYGLYHTVQAYKTVDFVTFENLGVALPMQARLPGTEFRPHVVFNNLTQMFLMWYEDRGSNLHGYSVAQSATPAGPFTTTHYNVTMPGNGRTGDFDIFIDDDGSAYHIRTGFDIVKLNKEFNGPEQHVSSFRTPQASEGPVVFKRDGMYYILTGTGCCACIGGSTIYVDMAKSLAGPWVYAGDVGSNPGPFDKHSPNNYVTKAQASAVFEVLSKTGETQHVWMGNQWNSGLSETPPGPRKHDLLYWTVLQFNTNGTIKQVEYQEEAEINL